MIRSFKCPDTENLFLRYPVLRFQSFEIQARQKLNMLNASTSLMDLFSPHSNRLEKLKGDRKEQYSIRINGQWRICFRWHERNAYDVEIVDYH
jgi:toxin HigB-1